MATTPVHGDLQSAPRQALSAWQFRLRTLLAAVVPCALVASLWNVGGTESVRMALATGSLIGLPFALLGEKKFVLIGAPIMAILVGLIFGVASMVAAMAIYVTSRGKARLLILCAAVSGAVIATMLGLYFLGIDIERLNDPGPHIKAQHEITFLAWWQIVGALLGLILAGLGLWCTKRSPYRDATFVSTRNTRP